jgi:hypothetical protein
MEKKLEKQIDNLIEHKKSLWTTLIILNGGIVGLILSFSSPIFCMSNLTRLLFLIIGLSLDFLFLEGIFKVNEKINNILK